MTNARNINLIVIALVILFVGVIVCLGYLIYSNNGNNFNYSSSSSSNVSRRPLEATPFERDDTYITEISVDSSNSAQTTYRLYTKNNTYVQITMLNQVRSIDPDSAALPLDQEVFTDIDISKYELSSMKAPKEVYISKSLSKAGTYNILVKQDKGAYNQTLRDSMGKEITVTFTFNKDPNENEITEIKHILNSIKFK